MADKDGDEDVAKKDNNNSQQERTWENIETTKIKINNDAGDYKMKNMYSLTLEPS